MSSATVVDTREDRAALFSKLQDRETRSEFWARVSDEADWTLEGTPNRG